MTVRIAKNPSASGMFGWQRELAPGQVVIGEAATRDAAKLAAWRDHSWMFRDLPVPATSGRAVSTAGWGSGKPEAGSGHV